MRLLTLLQSRKANRDPAIFLEATKLLKVEPDARVGIEDAGRN